MNAVVGQFLGHLGKAANREKTEKQFDVLAVPHPLTERPNLLQSLAAHEDRGRGEERVIPEDQQKLFLGHVRRRVGPEAEEARSAHAAGKGGNRAMIGLKRFLLEFDLPGMPEVVGVQEGKERSRRRAAHQRSGPQPGHGSRCGSTAEADRPSWLVPGSAHANRHRREEFREPNVTGGAPIPGPRTGIPGSYNTG